MNNHRGFIWKVVLLISVIALSDLATAESYIRKIAPERAGPLFSLSKKGFHIGWIYGSMHVGQPDQPNIGKNVLDILDQVDVIFFESNSDDSTLVDPNSPEISNNELAEILTEHKITKNLTDGRKRAHKKVTDPIRLMNQFAYSGIAARPLLLKHKECGYYIEFGTELQISFYIIGKNIEIQGLETPQQATEAISSVINEIKMGYHERKNKESNTNNEDYCSSLNQQRTEWANGHDTSSNDNTNSNILISKSNIIRNEIMTKTIEKSSSNGKKNFFIAGSSHLWGDIGILEKLRTRGFTIEQI